LGATVTWMPFLLHPEYPPEGLPREQLLARYGPGMTDRVRDFFASRGLPYNPNPDVVPNSLNAQRLTELARDLGKHAELHDRLMDAYWSEAKNIGDLDVLRAEAAAVGLPAAEVEEVLGSDRYRDQIEASTREASGFGANAVPAFVLDRRLLVLGAQPQEVFEQAFKQLDEST
jgi:predicted DsbA family dithiol-disulfide isomerase